MKLQNLPIRHKLIGLQLVTAFIVLLFYGVFLGINDQSLHRRSVATRMESLAQLVGANSVSALLFLDNAAAGEVLSTLANEPDITNGWILDADGTPFARYARPDAADTPLPVINDGECIYDGTFAICTEPVVRDGERAGTVVLRLDMRDKLVSSMVRSVTVAAVVMVIGLLVTFLLSMYTQSHIADPVMKLAGTVEKVSETGDYTLRATHGSTDEIGTLYKGFNSMMEQIQLRERERAVSEQRFTTLVANIPGATFRCRLDDQWTMEFISDAIRGISGYPAGDFLGNARRPFASIIHPDDRDPVAQAVHAAAERKEPYSADYRILHADGGERWVNERGQAVFNEHGEIAWIDGAIFDVTDRKKVQDRAELQRQQLMQADKMASLGILVSGVAHEINNPNNFIQLNSDNLRDIWTDAVPLLDRYRDEHGDFDLAGLPYAEIRDEAGPMIGSIGEGAERIKRIVQSLKDFARQDPGLMDADVKVNHVIESAVIILGNLIRKSTDAFRMELGDGLPGIRGNVQQVEQVIINLLTNACQALPDKSHGITVVTAYDAPAGSIIIRITDEGCGITPENRAHIMDPFFTTKRDSGGTGLGLSISFSIIREHGGGLAIDSEPGRGTSATITLPAAGAAGTRMTEND